MRYTPNMKHRIPLAVAVFLLFLGVLTALVAVQPSPAQVAGGWCGGSCANSTVPPPLEVAGGWCGGSCADSIVPPPLEMAGGWCGGSCLNRVLPRTPKP